MSYERPPLPIPGPRPSRNSEDISPPPYSEYDPLTGSPPPLPPRRSHNAAYSTIMREPPPPPLPPRRPKSTRLIDGVSNTLKSVSISDSNTKTETTASSSNIFDSAISTDPPSDIFIRVNHEVPLPPGIQNSGKPTETNKFYGNILLGSGTNPIWTHPYCVWYSTDSFPGFAVNHVKASQRVFDTTKTPPQFFFGPNGIKSLIYSSTDFNSEADISLGFSNITHLSIHVQLKKSDTEYIVFPLTQGMGFVTAIYYNLVPKLYSGVGFKSISRDASPRANIDKYSILLENNVKWVLYMTILPGQSLNMTLVDGNTIVGDKRVNGCILQVTADSNPELGHAAGCYADSAILEGSVSGSDGYYRIKYDTKGESESGTPLVYALPHHYENFDTTVMDGKYMVSALDTTTKGQAKGYLTDQLAMKVIVPLDLQLDPFTTIPNKTEPHYSAATLNSISAAAHNDVTGDVISESNLDSMYFSGKALAKYSWILYVCQYILKDSNLVQIILPKIKSALATFTANKQILPLRYDQTWYGLISSGDSAQDFGNSFYNDHHFHYSYHVIAAAIVAKIDREIGTGTWFDENKAWVETLLRDYANPSSSDPYFPVFRSFDWFNGHSWAKGLFESGDGKDQESTSEDINASYAIKLWGIVSGNKHLENIGNLMLGVQRTSVNHYFLYLDSNTTQPKQFIPNKVSGILFENKIDHTTYFGNNLEYIQMIHAIPITPASSFVRSPQFVQEEWDEVLTPIVNDVNDGWKGIIMLNVALKDPQTSYDFFNDQNFQPAYLDGGQSKTWSLAYAGAFI